MVRAINVGPMAINVLDLIGKDLVRHNGDKVLVKQAMTEFVIYVNGEAKFRTGDNIQASSILNNLEVFYGP